jgi:DNA-binding response OmpR family regulator
MLPDVNGNIVCKTIKQDPEFANTRIIIISGVINQAEIDDLLKAGAEAFIKKPFNITELIERIAVTLQA